MKKLAIGLTVAAELLQQPQFPPWLKSTSTPVRRNSALAGLGPTVYLRLLRRGVDPYGGYYDYYAGPGGWNTEGGTITTSMSGERR